MGAEQSAGQRLQPLQPFIAVTAPTATGCRPLGHSPLHAWTRRCPERQRLDRRCVRLAWTTVTARPSCGGAAPGQSPARRPLGPVSRVHIPSTGAGLLSIFLTLDPGPWTLGLAQAHHLPGTLLGRLWPWSPWGEVAAFPAAAQPARLVPSLRQQDPLPNTEPGAEAGTRSRRALPGELC